MALDGRPAHVAATATRATQPWRVRRHGRGAPHAAAATATRSNKLAPMRALLVDQSRDRAMLVAARSLAVAGFQVGTGAAQPSFASLSRHAHRHHTVHECSEDEDRFVADVAAAVGEGGYDIVFCTYETGLLALSRRRSEIGPAVWPYAPDPVVARAFDKLDLFEATQVAGLPAPQTEPATADALAAWTGPVVVKARNHVPKRFDTAIFAASEQARELVAEIAAEGGEPLLQTPLRGRMGAVVVVADRAGAIVAEVHQEALHTWPPGAGDTVLGVVVAPDPELSRGVHALVAELGWFGLVQVEFVRDDAGVAHVTDFNGRFYGSIALAVRAGANLPALWAQLALGRTPTVGTQAKLGTRFQWLNRDLAAGYAQGARGLAAALAAAPSAAHSMWDLRDPLPAIRYLAPEGLRRLRDRGLRAGRES
jgi:predicted ATP-grasp superfamily ATP-dependent carboligase